MKPPVWFTASQRLQKRAVRSRKQPLPDPLFASIAPICLYAFSFWGSPDYLRCVKTEPTLIYFSC